MVATQCEIKFHQKMKRKSEKIYGFEKPKINSFSLNAKPNRKLGLRIFNIYFETIPHSLSLVGLLRYESNQNSFFLFMK